MLPFIKDKQFEIQSFHFGFYLVIILVKLSHGLVCFSRFQTQTQLNRSRPSDFNQAISEARLAELGYDEVHDATPRKVHPSMASAVTRSSVLESEDVEDDVSIEVEKVLPKAPTKVHQIQLICIGACGRACLDIN